MRNNSAILKPLPTDAFGNASESTVTISPPYHRTGAIYTELISALFPVNDTGSVVLFTATDRGAGVTTTVKQLSSELIRAGKTVIALDSIHEPAVPAGTPLPRANATARVATIESDYLRHIRERYDAVLIDGGPLHDSPEVLRIIPHTNGVVLIVEADRTTIDQIDRARRCIQAAGGTILGLVMTKRRYPVPRWLSRFLQ